MEYTCRKLTGADIAAVMQMNRSFREGFACRQNAQAFLADPNNWLYAAVADGQILGFAYGYELKRLNGIGNMLYIHEVGVQTAFQRQGIGTRLLAELKQACRQKGICRLFLLTAHSNAGANALYRKLGGLVCEDSAGNDICYRFPINN